MAYPYSKNTSSEMSIMTAASRRRYAKAITPPILFRLTILESDTKRHDMHVVIERCRRMSFTHLLEALLIGAN